MKSKLMLFVFGMILLIGVVTSAGLIAYDISREKVIDNEDTAVLERAGVTDYTVTKKDMGNHILIFMNDEVTSKTIFKEKDVCEEKQCVTVTKTEAELQAEITAYENVWLQRQKDKQTALENALPVTEVKTIELVTIKESKLIDELIGGVLELK